MLTFPHQPHKLVLTVSVSRRLRYSGVRFPSLISSIFAMTDVGCTNLLDKPDTLPLLEIQANMVDSMSPPHTAEYISAQYALAQDCAALQRINEDIEECRMRLARAHDQMLLLERRRNVAQHRVSIHRARLSPLRTVPDHVLQEIFQCCLPDTAYIVPNTRAAPLVLTHVCRRWRIVAHGTSELWSSVALYDRGVWNYELEVEMMKRWLDRSNTRPIRLSITCPPCTDFRPHGNASCSDVFQLAVTHSSHLRDLCLNVDRTYLHHFMNHASLPVLQSVVISLHSAQRVDEPLAPPTPAFISTPNLRQVTFKGDGISINLIPRIHFPQLTHLSFDCNLTLDIALLFQDFPNLQHLTLTLSLSRDALRIQLPSQSDHRILGPSLLHLEVRLDKDMLDFGDPTTLETLLDQLELPALQTLTIAAPPGTRDFHARIGHADEPAAHWENHMAWVRCSSVHALLSRSLCARPRCDRRDL